MKINQEALNKEQKMNTKEIGGALFSEIHKLRDAIHTEGSEPKCLYLGDWEDAFLTSYTKNILNVENCPDSLQGTTFLGLKVYVVKNKSHLHVV